MSEQERIRINVPCSCCGNVSVREPYDGEELTYVDGYLFSRSPKICTKCLEGYAKILPRRNGS